MDGYDVNTVAVGVSDFPQPHAFLGVPADEITVFPHGLPECGYVDVGHSFRLATATPIWATSKSFILNPASPRDCALKQQAVAACNLLVVAIIHQMVHSFILV